MIKLELPYDIRLVPGTAEWLSNIARQYGVGEKQALSLCFVIEATLEKRVQKPCEEAPVFTVILEERSKTVSVSILDKGLPYVLTEKQREILLSGLVSSFSFEQMAIDGQRLRFEVKKENCPEPELPAPEPEQLLDRDVHCRTTREDDEDILRAIRVIYSNYGFRYIHQDIYRNDHFRAALQSGKYVSIQAENAHGQTIGHVALEEHDWFPGIPEVCNLVIREFARGLGASELLVASAVETGESRDFEGVFSMPVIHHPISQKLLNRQEFTASGFYFHVAPSNVNGPEDDDGNRVDAAICVKILNKKKPHRLYLPEECRDIVCGIFDKEAVKYEVLPGGESCRAEARMSYRFDAVNKLLELKVDEAGRDLSRTIAEREVPKDIEMSEVCMIYLNMNDPGCPEAYRYFRERGCIFTGCLPGSSSGDYLMLQHLKGAPIIQEKMVLEPDYRELLDRLLSL